MLDAGDRGLTSFGGPIAHLGYFRREYVERRNWLDAASYADLVALCQSLPGPASSQLGIAIGTRRAGPLGGVAAWLGFTLPSAIILVLFAQLTGSLDPSGIDWVHGLKITAVAVVFQAVLAMERTLTPDWPRRAIAALAAVVALPWTSSYADVAIRGGPGYCRAPRSWQSAADPGCGPRRTRGPDRRLGRTAAAAASRGRRVR